MPSSSLALLDQPREQVETTSAVQSHQRPLSEDEKQRMAAILAAWLNRDDVIHEG